MSQYYKQQSQNNVSFSFAFPVAFWHLIISLDTRSVTLMKYQKICFTYNSSPSSLRKKCSKLLTQTRLLAVCKEFHLGEQLVHQWARCPWLYVQPIILGCCSKIQIKSRHFLELSAGLTITNWVSTVSRIFDTYCSKYLSHLL